MPKMFVLPSPIMEIDFFKDKKITLLMKREDLIHPFVSGNKYRKLKYNLHHISDLHIKNTVTKGGTFSNHIHAAAAAGKVYNFNTFGIIRGEKISNKTLDFAEAQGMKLFFVSRQEYRKIDESNFRDFLPTFDEGVFFIPEGGTNIFAIKGVAEMVEEIREQMPILPDYICCACGTGGTISGIIEGAKGEMNIVGFSALNGNFMQKEVEEKLQFFSTKKYQNWQIQEDYHFGAYAKVTEELLDFVRFFKGKYQILLDPIYTSKMMFGIFDLIQKGFFKENSKILAIHTGGLQGWNGIDTTFLENFDTQP